MLQIRTYISVRSTVNSTKFPPKFHQHIRQKSRCQICCKICQQFHRTNGCNLSSNSVNKISGIFPIYKTSVKVFPFQHWVLQAKSAPNDFKHNFQQFFPKPASPFRIFLRYSNFQKAKGRTNSAKTYISLHKTWSIYHRVKSKYRIFSCAYT